MVMSFFFFSGGCGHGVLSSLDRGYLFIEKIKYEEYEGVEATHVASPARTRCTCRCIVVYAVQTTLRIAVASSSIINVSDRYQ